MPATFNCALRTAACSVLLVLGLVACGGGGTPTASTVATALTCPTNPLFSNGVCPSNNPATVLKATVNLPTPETGVWWNPAESGSGYVLEVQGTSLAIGFYKYETTGAPVWFTGVLAKGDDGVWRGDIVRYTGGQSLAGNYRAAISIGTAATVAFTPASTTSGSLVVSVGGVATTTPIQRLGFGSGASGASFQAGLWWNPAESGRGFVIDVQGSKVAMSSYMYDASGNPIWYLTVADLSSPTTFAAEMGTYASGQTLGGAYRAPIATASAGTVSFVATSSTTATLTLPGGKVVPLERFYFGKTELTWFNPPVKVTAEPMGKKLFGLQLNRLPTQCTSDAQQCWKDLLANGSIKWAATSATMTGTTLANRPIVIGLYVDNKIGYNGQDGLFHFQVYFADTGERAVGNDITSGGLAVDLDWVYGNNLGALLRDKRDGACWQLKWNPPTTQSGVDSNVWNFRQVNCS